MLQCVAVRCGVCCSMWCSALQCVAVRCRVWTASFVLVHSIPLPKPSSSSPSSPTYSSPPTLWHQIRTAPWWHPPSCIAWQQRGECDWPVVWEHKGMSSLDTSAINSEVSFVKEPDVYWVYGLGCVANKTASPYPPHRRHPLSVYGFVKEPYSHRLKRTLIAYT